MTPFRTLVAVIVVLVLTPPMQAGSVDDPTLNQRGSHEAFTALFDNSTATKFQDIVRLYDGYIGAHPGDVTARIEQLKFLGYVLDGESIPYDTVSQLFEPRKNDLYSKFPDRYDVLLFRSTEEDRADAIALLEEHLKTHPQISTDNTYWELFERLAQLYAGQEQPYKAIHYGVIAERLNDTLDITLLLAEQCEKAGDKKMAAAYLEKFPGKKRTYLEYTSRGELLLTLGQYERAADMFTHAVDLEKDNYSRLNLSKALMQLGRYNEARDALTNGEHVNYYNRAFLFMLFELDMRYGNADSALHSYNVMRDLGISADPLGKYRLELFFRHPHAAWQLRDTIGILLLLIVFILCCGIPVLWIAPVHYAGLLRKVMPPEHSRWNLKHFWIVSAVILVGDVAIALFFDYAQILTLIGSNAGGEAIQSGREMAWVVLLHIGVTMGSWLVFLRRNDIAQFWGTRWSKLRSIGIGLGWMFLIRIVFAICFYGIAYLFNADVFAQKGYELYRPLSLNMENALGAFRETFGWIALALAVGIVTPISEEVIFRSIVLKSMQRYIPFHWANFLQAVLFALIHVSPILMLNAFLVGITGGVLRNRSSSLAPSIVMHAANNLLVVGAMFLQSLAS